MEKKPVKRSEYIVELSRDHHAGLLFSWKIREGIKRKVSADRLLKYLNFFWKGHLNAHFREEEALLFNRSDDPFSQQAKTEHQQLEARLHQLNAANKKDITEFSGFAAALVEHIRFEERQCFPYYETHLSVTVLGSVSKYLKEQHPTPFKDDYPDEFWTDTGRQND